ncbi:restriction endonuclease [Lysinibacillus sphaericus]|uniref:Restriction endonuclease n=1 Tax=Lysinibacillus sphaericus TaxID=1421 RepID=A0A2S0JX19_LYSSH|nr:PmeII family type II restriction endonuclease [Lysinibacillus sphaericus]AVK95631.1 restriction endonuclease [Lysinibacillus sphaericus]MED4545605.1 PmeII family type II restriction endonuclease [Lysinibacillus sphaericus]TKI17599.1 restriction endonuclease [Lysinibacillus sphaericus]SUV18648.1 Uncharacterised protein [Lysinibacillus sphaericus]GEC82766.1 hypothetical protein LSP03_25090 [Lysinibacillus sphaericus]
MSHNRLHDEELDQIIENAKEFFLDEIVPSHQRNILKLTDIREFNLNPFLDKYKANLLTGSEDAESIARALVYPRVLGTSINTIFGSKLQKFCSEILEGFASTTSGIDIEFIDKIDGRRKYCQIKAGPNTINKDDVQTIIGHLNGVRNLARTNGLRLSFDDLIVGVLYGSKDELSNHYRVIDRDYPVIIGREFWHRLTGVEDFYEQITDAIAEVAAEVDGSEMIEDVIAELAEEIRERI